MKRTIRKQILNKLGIKPRSRERNKVTQVIKFIVNGKNMRSILDNFSDNVKLALVINNDYTF